MAETRRETIFEMTRIGTMVRVRAMDVASMVEITISGPVTASTAQLQNLAYQRLQYVLKKQGVVT
jgi:hypothetical protein